MFVFFQVNKSSIDENPHFSVYKRVTQKNYGGYHIVDAKRFGAFISERRKEHHMTQADLAGKVGVTDKAVSRWERGLGFPDINTIG